MIATMRGRFDVWAAAVVAVLLLGIFFRFGDLDSRLFWHDEVYTKFFTAGRSTTDWQAVLYSGEVVTAGHVQDLQRHDRTTSLADTVRSLARDEPQNPPLYYLLARAHVRVFGDSVGALRGLSALCGLLALPAMFWLCLELFGQRRIAWAAVLLLAVSPYFVLFATEARGYTLWGVWILVSSAALLRALRRGGRGAWALVTASVALSLYTAFASVWVVAGQVLFVIARDRGRLLRASWAAAGAMAAAAVLFLPWALVLSRHYEAFTASTAWSKTIVIPRPQLLVELAVNASRPFVDVGDPQGLMAWAAVLGCVLLAGTALARLAWEGSGGLVLATALVPLALLLIPDLLLGGIRSLPARYLFPVWLGVLVAVAWWLAREGPGRRARAAALAGILLLGIGSGFLTRGRETAWQMSISEAVPEAARILSAADRPLVVGNREAHFPGNLLALALLLDPSTALQFAPLWSDYQLPDHDGAIYLFSPNGPFLDRLERDHPVTARRVLSHLHLELWEVVGAAAP